MCVLLIIKIVIKIVIGVEVIVVYVSFIFWWNIMIKILINKVILVNICSNVWFKLFWMLFKLLVKWFKILLFWWELKKWIVNFFNLLNKLICMWFVDFFMICVKRIL